MTFVGRGGRWCFSQHASRDWRMVWRWQNRRAVGGRDVREAHLLRH